MSNNTITELVQRLTLGAGIARNRGLNLDYAKVADEAAAAITSQQAEIERLRALSVTNILLRVVPGEDGCGLEIYAQSVDDVVQTLTRLGESLETAQAKNKQILEIGFTWDVAKVKALMTERDELRARLTALEGSKISGMVDCFLGWKLPMDFAPDCGISFKPESDYEHPVHGRNKYSPTGTNLFTADQARQMFEYALSGAQLAAAPDYEALEREHFGDADKRTGIYAQPASAAVPEGWRLVPVEPTQEMISASMRVGLNTEWVYGIGDRTDGSEIYEAMLAAAPPQPASAAVPTTCPYCDGTGDVHSADGEWRGVCNCAQPASLGVNAQHQK